MKEKSILEQLQAPEFKASKSDRILMEYIPTQRLRIWQPIPAWGKQPSRVS